MQGKKILIIDDDEATVFGYTSYLSQDGYTVISAETLSEGMPLLASEHPDAVVFDIRLPDGNSLDVIPGVRAADGGLKILIVSGLADAATAKRAVECGADVFLVKPQSISELCRAIERTLEQPGPV